MSVVSGETKEWLCAPERLIKDRADWPKEVPKAKVHCDADEWPHVVRTMYDRNIVEMFDVSDVFAIDGEGVFVGAFGVIRPQDPVTVKGPGLRLIMNCIPIISYLHSISSEVETLPRGAQWKSTVFLDGHICWLCSEDQKSSFYLYGLLPNGNAFSCLPDLCLDGYLTDPISRARTFALGFCQLVSI